MRNLKSNCLTLVYGGGGTCKCHKPLTGSLDFLTAPRSYYEDSAMKCREQCCTKQAGNIKWEFIPGEKYSNYAATQGSCKEWDVPDDGSWSSSW